MILQLLFLIPAVALGVLVAVSVLMSLAAVVKAILPGAKVPLRYNLRNLQVRWKTTLVTALAFTLVIALLVVMLAFVRGMQALTEGSGRPDNIVILSDGATDEVFSRLSIGSAHLLPREVQEQIARDEQGNFMTSMEVYVIVTHTLPNPLEGGRKRRFVQMRGIENPQMAATVHQIELEPGGRWWSPSGVHKISRTVDGKTIEETVYEVVLGKGMAVTFGQDKNQSAVGPGEILEIGPRKWYVVGVMKSDGSTFGSEIWAKDDLVAKNFGRENSYSSFVVKVKDPAMVKQAVELLKKLQAFQFQAWPEQEYYARLTQTNQQFLYAVIFVAVVMAIGGVMGIMNTMFAAINQRKGDIGVMRLLGFTRWQILYSFQFESLVIALIGGILGCGLGAMADGWTASSIVSGGAGGGGKSVVLNLTVDTFTLAAGLVFTLLMGAVGGLIPSLSAMRLRPLESLR